MPSHVRFSVRHASHVQPAWNLLGMPSDDCSGARGGFRVRGYAITRAIVGVRGFIPAPAWHLRGVPWDDCGRCQRLSGDFPVAPACMPTWRVGDGINRPYFILPTSLHTSDFTLPTSYEACHRTCDLAVRDLSQPRRHSMPVAVATSETQQAAAVRNLLELAIGWLLGRSRYSVNVINPMWRADHSMVVIS
jgi:hypothetical protein